MDPLPIKSALSRVQTQTDADLGYLQSKRVVAYDGADQRARPYDMLRTQVIQSMGVGGWKVLGITSPTPGCGKTLTAVNLAFSIARQPDQAVVLVDLDLQRPQVANSLGLTLADRGMLDLLEERTTLQSAAIPVRAGNHRIAVLPTMATRKSSELMGSRVDAKHFPGYPEKLSVKHHYCRFAADFGERRRYFNFAADRLRLAGCCSRTIKSL